MATKAPSNPVIPVSCPYCRCLVDISYDGKPRDPIYGLRARLRKSLEKANVDSNPRQFFSDGWNSTHECDQESIKVQRENWDRFNRRHPWDSFVVTTLERVGSGVDYAHR